MSTDRTTHAEDPEDILLTSSLWQEIPEPENPFAAQKALCCGYDVFNDLLPNAQMADFQWLLLTGEAPTAHQSQLLNRLAICLANNGPRDSANQAAMSAAAGGSGAAASLIAGLAVAAGNVGGGRELRLAVRTTLEAKQDLSTWQTLLTQPCEASYADSWLPLEHAPGFDINGNHCSTPVKQALQAMVDIGCGSQLIWLQQNRIQLEASSRLPLSMIGVAAAAMVDLGLNEEQAEMLYLLLRLPGLAAHALEQRQQGWDQLPFYGDGLEICHANACNAKREEA